MKKRNLSPEAKAKKAAYDAEWRAKNKERVKAYRQNYSQQYYQENREKIREWQRDYEARTPERQKQRRGDSEKQKIQRREYSRRLRREAIEFLGGKCEECGIDDFRVLQIDHINGGGTKERKQSNSVFVLKRDVLEHGRNKYQILCANCHMLKAYKND